VQGEDEIVALADGGVDEQSEAVGRGSSLVLGRVGIGEYLFEGAVGQTAEEIIAGGEVPVAGGDPDTGIGRDRPHGDVQSFSMDSRRCGADQFLLVARRVTA
jgi:hypothetical protein